MFARVIFKGDFKVSLDTEDNAIGYRDIFVRDVLVNGAIVEKEANSDTILVTYNGTIYNFLIDKDD